MVRSFGEVLETSREKDVDMRSGALVRAVSRLNDALLTRGIYP